MIIKILPTLEDLARAYESQASRLLYVLTVLVALVILYEVLTWLLKRRLSKAAGSERQMAHVRVFLRIWKYAIIFIGALIVIFTYTQSLTALGVSAGFLGAALGWALQSPITGIAAWLMVMIKKPFQPGDRVIIDGIQGDVYDITMTHVYLEEVGGTASGEERSGRFVIIPTSTLFTAKIMNYTLNDEYVFKEVNVAITYESNLNRAVEILKKAAERHTASAINAKKTRPMIRMEFKDSFIELHAKYFVHVREATAVASAITQYIYEHINRTRDVEIAYPHLQVFMHGKTPSKFKP